MGKMLGSFADDNELDRPDLNKCPDCDCFFASDTCPLCKKVCPEEMRAGNRKPVKQKKHKRSSGYGRVTFISWYHRWWFILLMLWLMPIVGIILLISSPHDKWKKWLVAGICAVWLLFSYIGIGSIIGMISGIFDQPVDTSLSREAYIERCDTVTAAQYYRGYADYEDDFVTVELKIYKNAMFTDISGYDQYTYYICTPVDNDEYFIILRDCLIDSNQSFIPGDIVTVYGQGDIFCKAFDTEQSIYQGPCLNMAYAELTK